MNARQWEFLVLPLPSPSAHRLLRFMSLPTTELIAGTGGTEHCQGHCQGTAEKSDLSLSYRDTLLSQLIKERCFHFGGGISVMVAHRPS